MKSDIDLSIYAGKKLTAIRTELGEPGQGQITILIFGEKSDEYWLTVTSSPDHKTEDLRDFLGQVLEKVEIGEKATKLIFPKRYISIDSYS